MNRKEIERRRTELARCENKTEEMRLEERELWFRGMINSCLTYGGPSQIHDGKTWGRYGRDYAKELGDERAMRVWEDQRDYFNKHAKVYYATYTDSEGCTYNSVAWE